jgi:hypothetical protein
MTVEDQVVPLPVREVLAGVVDHVVRPNGTDEVHLRRAAHARDVRPEHLRKLHGKRAHPSRGANDQGPLLGLNPSLVPQTLEGGASGDGHARRLFEGEARRLGRKVLGSSARVLGEGPAATAEHLIARPKLRDILADRLDAPGDIPAQHSLLGLRSPKPIKRTKYGKPVMRCHTSGPTPAA